MEPETTDFKDLQESSIWPKAMWPEIIAAADQVGNSTPEPNLILEYWKPLRIFLLYRCRYFPEIRNRADELLQEFAEDMEKAPAGG